MNDKTMAEKLSKILHLLHTYGPERFAREVAGGDENEINALLRVLEEHTDYDASNYKSRTLQRAERPEGDPDDDDDGELSLVDHHNRVMYLLSHDHIQREDDDV